MESRVIAKLPAGFRNGNRFTKADFDIDLEAETATCPAGHATEKYYQRRDAKGRRVRSYRFRPRRAMRAR